MRPKWPPKGIGDAMGRTANDDSEEAASHLRLLDTHFHEHPQHGPAERRTTSATPGTPLNLGIVDYIDRCVAEVVDHARTEAPAPVGPLPASAAGIYDWYLEHTADAGPEVHLQRDIIIKRQQLEHAITLGDTDAVCKHPCPACGTWGLEWSAYTHRAMCINGRCRDRHGMGRTWTLGRLATQHVLEQENQARCAT